MEMLTLAGKPIEEMNLYELKTEKQVQLKLARSIYKTRNIAIYFNEKRKAEIAEEEHAHGNKLKAVKDNEDYIEFLTMYEYHIRCTVDKIKEMIPIAPKGRSRQRKRRSYIIKRDQRGSQIHDNKLKISRWETKLAKDGLVNLWDREKFMLVAKDRGYYTDHAITSLISRTCKLSIRQVDVLLESGRWSLGQALIIGAEFQMTPKEFAEVFMHGYFKEVSDGHFEASKDNLTEGATLYQIVNAKSARYSDEPDFI